MTSWVVVADAARARVFEAESLKKDLVEIMDKANPTRRIPQNELASDEPGRNRGPGGMVTHGMQEKVTPQDTEDQRFAADIIDEVRQALDSNRISNFYLIAPPHFLGVLRGAMSGHVAKALGGDLNKSLTTHSLADIKAHLGELT